MMNAMVWVSALLLWLLVVAVVGLAVLRRIAGARSVIRWRSSPAVLPYSMLFQYRYRGLMGAVLKNAVGMKIAPELIEAHRAITLEGMIRLRDAAVEIDHLPTVQTGKAAMGIDTIFELTTRPAHRIKSPYTHPMQYPAYFVPGVPARTFYDAHEFEWASALEEAYPIIKEELMGVLQQNGTGFKAYMSEHQTRLAGWNTFNFFFYGRKIAENCERCPRTTAILESLPRFERDHIMFSALNPHSRIAPHTGPMNGIIRAHLGLVTPPGAYIRVGRDERTWQEGKLLVFDDSFEHEVWNHSDFVRIVLFINFWHPAFQPEEIPALERFRAAYELAPLSRVHERNQMEKRAHDLAAAVLPA